MEIRILARIDVAVQDRTPPSMGHGVDEQEENLDDYSDKQEISERELVESYVTEHTLETTLNDVLNQIVADRPEDPLLAISTLLFERASAAKGILHVAAREIFDGLGKPTILVAMHTGKGVFEASCSSEARGLCDAHFFRPKKPTDPTGASATTATETPDAEEAQDDEQDQEQGGAKEDDPAISEEAFLASLTSEQQQMASKRFDGRGFRLRARRVEQLLKPKLLESDPMDQAILDDLILSLEPELGRNACMAASIALCKAGAKYSQTPLSEYIAKLMELPLENSCIPMPMFSCINGGKYGCTKSFVQEIFMIPTTATSFKEAMELGILFHKFLKDSLEKKSIGLSNVGSFGGFAPLLTDHNELFRVISTTLESFRSGLFPQHRFELGIEIAAGEFVVLLQSEVDDKPILSYNVDKWSSNAFMGAATGLAKSSEEFHELIRGLIREFDLSTVIDPFDKLDIKSFASLMHVEHDAAGAEAASSPDAMNPSPPAKAGTSAGETTAIGGDANSAGTAGAGGDPSGGAPRAPHPIGNDANCLIQIAGRSIFDYQGLDNIQQERACNTFLVHLSDFPTVTKCIRAIADARRMGVAIILGVNAGEGYETHDFLIEMAIGAGIGQVKFGGLASGDCIDRYNRLLVASEAPSAPVFVGEAYRR